MFPLVTTPMRPIIITSVAPFVLTLIFAPNLRTIIYVDDGVVSLMPLYLYDFYFGPDNGTRSIDNDFMYNFTLCTDDTITPTNSTSLNNPTYAYSLIQYENNFAFN